jgi:hypothetical protein
MKVPMKMLTATFFVGTFSSCLFKQLALAFFCGYDKFFGQHFA